MKKLDFKTIIPSFGFPKRDLIAIELSSTALKIAHIKPNAQAIEILNLLSRSIKDAPDEEIARIIKMSLSELKVKNPFLVDVIPAHAVITKNIEVPSLNPQEIKEIINLQAGRHTPYSRDEIIVDYLNVGVHKHSYSKILLLIVTRNVIRRHFEIVEAAGAKIERVLLSPEGIAAVCDKTLHVESREAPITLLTIDELYTDFSIVFKEKVTFIRSIPIGAQHLMEEEEKFKAKFAEEVKSSLETYQSEDIEKPPRAIVLVAPSEELQGLVPIVHEVARLPVKIVPYLKNMVFSNELFEKIAMNKYLSFCGVVASLASYKELKIDLIPDEIKFRKSLEERASELLKTGMLALTGFVLIFLILLTKIYFDTLYLKKLDSKYAPVNREAQKLENDFSKISRLKSCLAKRGFSLEALTELYNLVTDEIRLSDIRFEEQGKFTLRGTAATTSDVFSFVEKMSKTKYYNDVKTKYTTKRREGTKDVTDFEITSLLVK